MSPVDAKLQKSYSLQSTGYTSPKYTSPITMASSSNNSTTAKAKNTYYQSKQGTITILTLDNYPQFKVIVILALMAGGWWKIFTSQQTRIDENQDSWDQEASKVIGLLNNCVISAIRLTFQPFLILRINPIGLWDHLKSYDTTTNPVLVNNLRTEFDNFSFDESEVKIMDGVLEL